MSDRILLEILSWCIWITLKTIRINRAKPQTMAAASIQCLKMVKSLWMFSEDAYSCDKVSKLSRVSGTMFCVWMRKQEYMLPRMTFLLPSIDTPTLRLRLMFTKGSVSSLMVLAMFWYRDYKELSITAYDELMESEICREVSCGGGQLFICVIS